MFLTTAEKQIHIKPRPKELSSIYKISTSLAFLTATTPECFDPNIVCGVVCNLIFRQDSMPILWMNTVPSSASNQ